MGFTDQGLQSRRMVVFAAVFLLMTFLILYSSNAGSNASNYTSFRVSINHVRKPTNLKKWAGKDGYVPILGNKTMTLHCQYCALVTSSSHVLGSHAGDDIDHTECVIRMNDAPTLGYEADVGNRTSVRVVAHSSVFRVIRRPNEILHGMDSRPVIIFWGPPNKIGKDAKGTLYRLIQRFSMTYTNVSCFSITPNKMHKFDSLFQKETGRDRQKSHSWLSTGWFTMVIAIEICDNIKVYGMVPPSHCGKKSGLKKMPYHYYKPRGADECVTYLQNESGRRGNHHRFITEKQVFARWAKQYNINFTHPTW
ncbi:alpha-N-acetylgalactosaminide alpha-2,6-sialyltransferase 6 [Thalassophryne amazonica]|uniref:alpha-N-acetylgalactosaminide alpha-2,6-sialyltransferase 6 n=1 Tax=Thalassophryne amazonica TaxID=390379 RepID=UPI00147196FE|nr:alpha-N-acetylgalactosaminide alpha-2,6-sialyltransferase 6 [Thalassophryne amazonica]